MSRESRTLLAVVVIAILGVSSLGYMAHRYGKIARERHPAVERAVVQVDEFIRVRRVLRLTIDSATPASLEPSLRSTRDRAIAEEGIDPRRYEEVRRVYRDWRAGRLQGVSAIGVALERRAEELRLLDLGDYELLDS